MNVIVACRGSALRASGDSLLAATDPVKFMEFLKGQSRFTRPGEFGKPARWEPAIAHRHECGAIEIVATCNPRNYQLQHEIVTRISLEHGIPLTVVGGQRCRGRQRHVHELGAYHFIRSTSPPRCPNTCTAHLLNSAWEVRRASCHWQWSAS